MSSKFFEEMRRIGVERTNLIVTVVKNEREVRKMIADLDRLDARDRRERTRRMASATS